MRGAQTGLIHIEYGFAASGNLDYLKLWSSIARGHWLLACEHWMSLSTFHRTGVHFDNGYRSEGLSDILESVMQHQTAFSLPPDLGRQGLLQISTPTEEESTAAAAALNESVRASRRGVRRAHAGLRSPGGLMYFTGGMASAERMRFSVTFRSR
jgi:hypothetical protein